MKKYKTAIIKGSEYVRTKEIEYKKVEIEDFNSCGYKAKKTMIQLDKNGYLGDTLVNTININEKSTDVLNITTGSGKTTAIYQLIKKINDEEKDAIIIVATPYTSLVNKDYEYLVSKYGINPDIITKYSDLTKDLSSDQKNNTNAVIDNYIRGRKIHITTINALLRNPGDTAFEQNVVKANYFTNLLSYCKKNKKKVYLFLDEIHASIHNFRNEYIFYLTMWKEAIQKCIISTATYTEPVNIVIKHMAYMTNDVINIYETERTKKKVLSPLDMAFFPYKFPKDRIGDLSLYITEYLSKNITNTDKQNFHIICYSRKIAELLYKNLFKSDNFFFDYSNTSLLTSYSDDKYIEGFNHIGTNFSTGVDIKKEGDILIIIFPFKYKDEDVKGEEGIFYDGLPSILQSVARLRSKGRILFIIPPMKAFIKDDMTRELFNKIYTYKSDDEKDKVKEVQEDFLDDERKILENFLNRRNKKVEDEKAKYKSFLDAEKEKEKETKYLKMDRPVIDFPSKDTFTLERGQEFIKYRSYKSGKYITPYVVWAALNDQYVNCSLDNVYHFIRLNHYISVDKISQHLKDTLPENSLNEDFAKFYADAKKMLTQYDNGEKLVKVKIKENGSDKVLSINTVTIFWKIVAYYYSNKTNIAVTSLDNYYKYSVNDRWDKISKLYKQLKSIIQQINVNVEGKFLFEKEALSDKSIVQYEDDLKQIITAIKANDCVIKTLLASKNAFWVIKKDFVNGYTRYLLQTFFYEDSRKKDGSRKYKIKEQWV